MAFILDCKSLISKEWIISALTRNGHILTFSAGPQKMAFEPLGPERREHARTLAGVIKRGEICRSCGVGY